MNWVHIIGRLTADPKKEATKSGKVIARFSVAVDRGRGDNKTTDFFRCTAWERKADPILQYLHKGDRVSITGSVTASAYMANGEARASLEIPAVDDCEFLESKRDAPQAPKKEFTPVQEDLPW